MKNIGGFGQKWRFFPLRLYYTFFIRYSCNTTYNKVPITIHNTRALEGENDGENEYDITFELTLYSK